MIRIILFLAFAFLFLKGNSQSLFSEVSSSVGINHRHFSYSEMGGGVAFFDFGYNIR